MTVEGGEYLRSFWLVVGHHRASKSSQLEQLTRMRAGQRDGCCRRQADGVYTYTYGVPYMEAANGRV